jgi:hypothetical protein
MNKERDLRPWIFGALLLASLAIAITAGSLQHRNPAADPLVSSPSASLTVAPPAALRAEPAVLSIAADTSANSAPTAADAWPTTSPPVPSGQIWECTTNGLKTFSNNPCGDKSSLREVGPINTMAATQVRYIRASGPDPRYAPEYVDEGAYADQNEYSDPAAESRGSSYAVIQGFAYLPRRRAEHPHRPFHHYPGMPVRRN